MVTVGYIEVENSCQGLTLMEGTEESEDKQI